MAASSARAGVCGRPSADQVPTVATFSIVACDTAAGIWGVAVASKFFSVGSVVPWTQGDVGAVATQSQANTTYGPAGLALLAAGKPAQEALDALIAADEGRAHRQVGIVDAAGRAATYTGPDCIAWAGGKTGYAYAVQGNILTGPEVVEAMARTFESTEGYLGERMLAALEAGDAAGGDSRGRQSACLKLAKTGAGFGGWNDVLCDLRVDDHASPFTELRRLYTVWRPNMLVLEGYRRVEEGRFAEAFAAGEAAARIDKDSGDPFYHLACYHARAGDAERAMHFLSWAVELNPKFKAQARTDTDLAPLREREDWKRLIGS
ncbi:MAG: DUF1028 domain-containing protein [Candidatus Eisenbacteria bacterium]|nr:DUF1028 domain-containing protein [Candidatus Eisenbacteria bacterium]